MLDSSSGKILVADHDGVYVIKMVGDVRLTLCIPFDEYIEGLFQRNDFCTIVFDLSQAEGLDSTTLGLIAKIAVKSQNVKNIKPAVLTSDPDILRLLSSMGIDSICQMIDDIPQDYCVIQDFSALPECDNKDQECLVKDKVLEAHCVLMGLNEANQKTFKDLVQTLSHS